MLDFEITTTSHLAGRPDTWLGTANNSAVPPCSWRASKSWDIVRQTAVVDVSITPAVWLEIEDVFPLAGKIARSLPAGVDHNNVRDLAVSYSGYANGWTLEQPSTRSFSFVITFHSMLAANLSVMLPAWGRVLPLANPEVDLLGMPFTRTWGMYVEYARVHSVELASSSGPVIELLLETLSGVENTLFGALVRQQT